MSGNFIATKRLMAVALLMSILGFLCSLIATFGPAWIVIKRVGFKWTLKEGVWLAQLCDESGNECGISTRESILADIGLKDSMSRLTDGHWVEFKVFTVLSIAWSLVAVVIATFTVTRMSHKAIAPPVLAVCFVACLSSCIFLLIPVLKISAVSKNLFEAQAWSMWVASIGVLTQFMSSSLLVFANYQNCRQTFKHKQSSSRRRFADDRHNMCLQYVTSLRTTASNQSQRSLQTESTSGCLSDARSPNATNSYIGSERNSVNISPSVAGLPAYEEIAGP